MMSKKCLLILILGVFVVPGVTQAQSAENDPDPERFRQDIEQFVRWDAKNSFPSDAILFVGSSSIRFWKTHKAFPQYPVINRGFGGSHISDVQYYYEEVIAKYKPALIVFYAGDNDIAADKPISQVFGDYKELTNRILSDFPDAKFLFVAIKPSSSRWNYWPRMEETNNRIKAYNRNNKQLYYVDLATPLLNDSGKPRDSLYLDDLLHLNEDGYDTWNNIAGPKLEKMYGN